MAGPYIARCRGLLFVAKMDTGWTEAIPQMRKPPEIRGFSKEMVEAAGVEPASEVAQSQRLRA